MPFSQPIRWKANTSRDLVTRVFPRLRPRLHVFTLISHWLLVRFIFVMIGRCDYFGFGFTTLHRKALWGEIRSHRSFAWRLRNRFQTVLYPAQLNPNIRLWSRRIIENACHAAVYHVTDLSGNNFRRVQKVKSLSCDWLISTTLFVSTLRGPSYYNDWRQDETS